jgi:hypothetical protein
MPPRATRRSPRRAAPVYVYALAARGLPRRFTLGSHALQALPVADVDAVVEPRAAPPPPSEESLRAQHALVVDLADRVSALLPVRFGTLVAASELEARLSRARETLRPALERVAGRRQMTLRIVAGPAAKPRKPSRASSGTAYLNERRGPTADTGAHVAAVRRAVGRFVVEERIDRGEGAVRTVIFHLVNRSRLAEYRAALEAVAPTLRPARLIVSGPWPPFAFVPELL